MALFSSQRSHLADAYTNQAAHLSLLPQDSNDPEAQSTKAVKATFITPRDPVIETANGGRLPTVPLDEAEKLNRFKGEAEQSASRGGESAIRNDTTELAAAQETHDGASIDRQPSGQSVKPGAPLRTAIPAPKTHPLFPQMPLYGPPTLLRNLQSRAFQLSSACLSLAFLGTIVLGSLFTSIPLLIHHLYLLLTFQNPNRRRPFYEEEKRREKARNESASAWKRKRRWRQVNSSDGPRREECGGLEE
ncbi:MAG: hypothetical protein Q9226_008227, partial [Calogaya cf. arnoldii]